MVAPTNFNLQNLHGRMFEGFVQFQQPNADQSPSEIPPVEGATTWFRMKERQTMTFKMQFDRATHYDDAGLKALDPAGHSHSFSMDLKLTSDLFDNVFSESSDKQTLSYWIYRNTTNQPIEIIFVTSFTMLEGPAGSTTENDINLKFVLDPSTFSTGLGPTGGAPSINVSGVVTSITDALRATTTDQ
jgi:hypothetical protein